MAYLLVTVYTEAERRGAAKTAFESRMTRAHSAANSHTIAKNALVGGKCVRRCTASDAKQMLVTANV